MKKEIDEVTQVRINRLTREAKLSTREEFEQLHERYVFSDTAYEIEYEHGRYAIEARKVIDACARDFAARLLDLLFQDTGSSESRSSVQALVSQKVRELVVNFIVMPEYVAEAGLSWFAFQEQDHDELKQFIAEEMVLRSQPAMDSKDVQTEDLASPPPADIPRLSDVQKEVVYIIGNDQLTTSGVLDKSERSESALKGALAELVKRQILINVSGGTRDTQGYKVSPDCLYLLDEFGLDHGTDHGLD